MIGYSAFCTIGFQLTAARRRLGGAGKRRCNGCWFQLTAARRRLAVLIWHWIFSAVFQLTAARRRLVLLIVVIAILKAFQLTAARRRLGDYNANGIRTWSFNSQPPEGGWSINTVSRWPP